MNKIVTSIISEESNTITFAYIKLYKKIHKLGIVVHFTSVMESSQRDFSSLSTLTAVSYSKALPRTQLYLKTRPQGLDMINEQALSSI